MLTGKYLERINVTGPQQTTTSTLHKLHKAHLLAVPFENLDIHLGRPISLEFEQLYQKIVANRRGGFCYELNGMFAWLLSQLGFEVTMLSAQTVEGGGYGPDFDHLILQVRCPADTEQPETPWLADVGWGDSFRRPLRLDRPGEFQFEGERGFRLDQDGQRMIMWQQDKDGKWEKQYRFSLVPRVFSEFNPMCSYHQRSPDSVFTQRRICTLAMPNGRITLSDKRFIETIGGRRTERQVDDAEFRQILRNRFGIDLPPSNA